MDQEQQSRWRPTRGQVLWTVGIVVAVVVLIRIGYALPWAGFGQAEVAQHVRPAKTLWDWMKLLIVPAVLGAGGYFLASWFTRAQNRATLVAEERRAQDEALQAYLDQMSAVLIPNNEQPSLQDESPPVSLRAAARARTLTLLSRLDGDRTARVVQFLYESDLITKDKVIVDLKGSDLHRTNLSGANLSGADLRKTDLSNADLSNADLSNADLYEVSLQRADLFYANLSNADLREAELSNANLRRVRLSRANLRRAKLSSANLRQARLDGANLSSAVLSESSVLSANLTWANLSLADLGEADLSGAYLEWAKLSNAKLGGANLSKAILRGADLRGAVLFRAKGWTEEQLAAAKSLEGAIMPDGQRYEDWLKSKRRGEGGENSGP